MLAPHSRRWVIAAVTFGFAAVALWWLVAGRTAGTVRLVDGREVSILAVTYGTNHVFIEGSPWARLARPFVSRSRAYRLGLRIYQHPTPYPTLMVWTRWHLPASNSPPGWASVRDIHGLETEPIAGQITDASPARRRALIAWQFDNFPRSQASFSLRLYERDPSYRPSRVGEISIKPPKVRSPHPFPALPTPLSQTNGSLEFSLISLRTGEHPPPALTNRPNFIARPTMAWFDVRENGALQTNWTIRNIQVVGPTGNRFPPIAPLVEETNGRLGIAFTEVFWPDEPGWRMTVEFARSRDFPTNRLWTFEGLPAALKQPPFTTNILHATHGVTVERLGVSGSTWTFDRPYRRGAYRRNTDISLVYTTAAPDLRMDLAQALDEHGQLLRFGHGTDHWRGRYLSGLELRTNTTQVDLTFAIHGVERVEFFVRPELSSKQRPYLD